MLWLMHDPRAQPMMNALTERSPQHHFIISTANASQVIKKEEISFTRAGSLPSCLLGGLRRCCLDRRPFFSRKGNEIAKRGIILLPRLSADFHRESNGKNWWRLKLCRASHSCEWLLSAGRLGPTKAGKKLIALFYV